MLINKCFPIHEIWSLEVSFRESAPGIDSLYTYLYISKEKNRSHRILLKETITWKQCLVTANYYKSKSSVSFVLFNLFISAQRS